MSKQDPFFSVHGESTQPQIFNDKLLLKARKPHPKSPLFDLLGERKDMGYTIEDFMRLAPPIVKEDEMGQIVRQDNLNIDAGWTYFGQLLSHDLTFRRPFENTSPKLNLDCIYGLGPVSNAHLYETGITKNSNFKGVWFALDRYTMKMEAENSEKLRVPDVYRIGPKKCVPVMADTRNDDNFLLNQLHCTLARFHNVMAAYFYKSGIKKDLFQHTRRYVIWTYQWIIVNQYLPRMTGEVIAELLEKDNFKILFGKLGSRSAVLYPEFITAALRVGHSQVRAAYNLNEHNPNIELFSRGKIDLQGFKRDERRGAVDWSYFFDFNGGEKLQKSKPIDLFLAFPMQRIPFPPGTEQNIGGVNIRRSFEAGLLIQEKDMELLRKVYGIPTIENFKERLNTLYKDQLEFEKWYDYKNILMDMNEWPLWVFLLAEARILGADNLDLVDVHQTLGPLGAQIIAENLMLILLKDKESYRSVNLAWNPLSELPKGYSTVHFNCFSIADVIQLSNDHLNFLHS
ncbi:MAG TPA: peroxidase family protein [Saprospiraceae bacterium]|nr:peroxidase family protein [Saprospiraceae bacterium]HPI04870.1 peroxidase family protein [Saprospiraceae bacterium]